MATKAQAKTEEEGKPVNPVAEKEDKGLVEEAAEHITKILAETTYRGATEIGEYVLKHFFNDDAELAQSRDPYKNASYRSLTEKCETQQLPISRTTLYNAVAVVVRQRTLPDAKAYKQLPQSHQVTLLPVKEPAKVETLAEKAMEKKLSVRQLKAEVKKVIAKAREDEPRGRKPLPVIVKTLNGSVKLFTLDGSRRSFTKTMVEELDEDQAKLARKAAEKLITQLQDLLAKLKKA
ncbi:MAG: hypothetical protein HY828_01385 [Actinobacteria bacterium]|nr:hypothetical protein [Actinomycetota bacterium]